MTYRSLLVQLDGDKHCAARTAFAIRLAKQHDCHLVGLAATGLVDMPVAPETAATLTDYAALAWDTLRDQAESCAQSFRDSCRTAGLKSFETVVDERDKAASIVRHAHCSDLVVLTQAEPGTPGHGLVQATIEQVVMNSARPTLIIPYAGRFEATPRSALVAWDDSREASRAVSDALPLLRACTKVEVVAWKESADEGDASMRPRLDSLHKWLLWQGVTSQVRMESTEIGIAEAMLSCAADLGSELIVMGAYGHTRLTERILGGATRGLLQSMTAPVLMSH